MKFYNKKKIAEWDSKSVSEFWDFVSKQEDKYFTNQVGNVVIKFSENFFDKNSTILDYGSGPGFLTKQLLDKNFKVAALDFSHESIKILNNKLNYYENFIGAYDISQVDLLREKFDLIFVVEVVEHLNDDFLDELLNNVYNLLSENGKVIITTPNNERLEDSYIYCPFSDVIFHRWQHVRSWNKDSLNIKLNEKGFNNNILIETHFFNKPKWSGLNRKTIANFLEYLKMVIEKKKPHLVAIAQKN
ncbi:class I SAM-dependent methyltransferase [Algoriphagus aquimarinus]|uniref:Class I SAM-dependent methyltransferase n=1 Tax=Algoriphagus aquimarinus TaxID=237018 RepID=A0A5C7A8F2_9BACT|nr:class I SAM-dependent methyltransferase [Algoriphagus aquimarinus]TXE02414.1 class I SAM-dependent methyltransferase [Algoriphagus aquimarinus]